MTYEVAIVADDLTGAGDTAVQFAEAGWPTLLRLGGDRPGAADGSGGDISVVAITTDSRARPDAGAADLVREATTGLLRSGVTHLFKKVDSTLRGPVRAEIDAMLDVLAPGTVALVCPAFPAVGRTVVDGVLLVEGRPVSETAVGRDPVTPVTVSHLPTLLDAPLVRLDPRGTPAAWAAEVRAAGSRIVVLDAASDEDLDRIARTVADLGERALPVGSAGLAGPLAARWRPREAQAPGTAPEDSAGAVSAGDPAGTALVVVTSLHDASRAQAEALAAYSAEHLRPTARDLTEDDAWAGFLDRVRTAAAGRPATLLLSTPDRGAPAVDPELVARRLSAAAAHAVAAGAVAGLVATGGDGARAVLERLGGTGIRLYDTVEPGVPLGVVVGGPAAGLPVATKAGGFGSPDVLIKAAQAVRTERSHR
ncbi:four-carbon acid sugar kinase family protein [Streptomyces sp. NBC_01808]|uniref:four-carbon acid sugar kinase family protein n=1 Tax=Streptomyces sp. NBC_01808 TaxID=2975947 RepID=UPI002DD831E0|nr:four-carbon acid sugar kinase family protein [Streptomyces sp. NBC_01808]WSA41153.1 four-carbon acid sugar kinase family protein [Streptomyces sp. NBC_01808]